MAHYLILELTEAADGEKPRWEVAEIEASSREKAAAYYAENYLEVDGKSHRLNVYLLREPKPSTIRVQPQMVRADLYEVIE